MKLKFVTLVSFAFLSVFAIATEAAQTVILVRHAELQGSAMAQPKDMALSEIGKARADRLAGILKEADVGAIYVTDYVRTIKTAEPLARDLNKDVTVVPKGDPRDLVDRIRKGNGGQTVLLVGHTDTLPGLLKALGHPAEVKIEKDDYGSIFVVVPSIDSTPALLRLRY
jgi:broad specificity phosphatase PhoE